MSYHGDPVEPQHIPDLGKYYLITFDENGVEQPKPDGTLESETLQQDLNQASPPYTDVFFLNHGWQGDVPMAIEQYDRWIVTMAAVQQDPQAAVRLIPGFKPLIVALHWPSLPWPDTLGRLPDEADPSAVPNENQVQAWVARIASTQAARDAIRTILESAHRTDDADTQSPDVLQAYPFLPPNVREAYAVLLNESQLAAAPHSDYPGAEQEGFNPQAIVIEAQRASPAETDFPARRGKLGNLVHRHRDILLSPLRQLSFWKMKDRARIVGETGGNKLLRMLQKSAFSGCRFHLMGHSFGCIVVSAAVAGAENPNEPPQPVDSLFLVQGAMSLWSYAERVPYAGDKPGSFHRIVRDQLVRGPIVTTRSAGDTALGVWYPIGSGIMGLELLAEHGFPRFGAMGSFGIQGLPGVVDLPMGPVAFVYPFARGRLYNLDASHVIRARSGLAGSHNDIAQPEVVHAFWAMVSPGRTINRVSSATSMEKQTAIGGGSAEASIADPYESTLQAPSPSAEPPAAERLSVFSAHKARWINAEIEDHDRDAPLLIRQWYTLAFSVDVQQRKSAVMTWRFVEDNLFPEGTDNVTLRVQLSTEDFQLSTDDLNKSEGRRPLEVFREGRSRKARFDIRPRYDGRSWLRVTFLKDRNLVQQMEVAFIVGATPFGPVEVLSRLPALTISTRSPLTTSTIAAMQARDLCLMIRRDIDGGYDCQLIGSVWRRARLRIDPIELALAVDDARRLMGTVIWRSRNGRLVFQDGIDIQREDELFALEKMARAGSDLFRRIFTGSMASESIGSVLQQLLSHPAYRLKLQVVADTASVPWAWLYVSDISDWAALSWDNFIGMRHVIEEIPFQSTLAVSTPTISSDMPYLEVSVNVNENIGPTAYEQIDWWSKVQSSSRSVKVTHRSTRDEVITALADGGTADQIIYFYCHAHASELGPDTSSLWMTDADITLGELRRDLTELRGNPLVFINACESGALSPAFYDGFVPYFMAKGARGVMGTVFDTPAIFATVWAKNFFRRFLDGEELGEAIVALRRQFLEQHGNPLGLLYAVHCDAHTRIHPAPI